MNAQCNYNVDSVNTITEIFSLRKLRPRIEI